MQLLHELLFCLAGVPGQVFEFEASGQRRGCLPAEAEALEHLAVLGILYKGIQESVVDLSARGAYAESLGAGIQESLQKYTRLIVQMEEGLLSDSTPSLARLETHLAMVREWICT